ncbi:hypothetical protein KC19_2G153100 [Ceratodon purpureus]|uniref:Protein kinase domain-containing protein n=1 Tax=Ceratodon purpureus TaxID=3225 RepID=A0A8T0IVQ4_CERPU|nr:hypothetical protein KC19_2G153100 [Ceratodon purpureus]
MEFLKRLTHRIRPQKSLKEQIEQSKSHWSEIVVTDTISIEEEVADNLREFQRLQSHPAWGCFFKTFGYDTRDFSSSGSLEIGKKLAEGAQGELFHAKVTWKNPKSNEIDLEYGRQWVLKVFKKGTLLRHLQSQWPQGMLQHHAEIQKRSSLGLSLGLLQTCDVCHGVLLENGRFAFMMQREKEDLRSFIDRQMKQNMKKGFGSLAQNDIEYIMSRIAQGVEWLHNRNIVHRDLKASNVLHTRISNDFIVADFECSVGVVGTGFWRAPEILQACKDGVVYAKIELFSKEVDIYSYGMTCYEVLSGKLPFQEQVVTLDDIINGKRPEVPEYVEDWIRELLNKCWQSDPIARPSIGEILEFILANSRQAKVVDEAQKKWKLNPALSPMGAFLQ